MAKPLCIDLFCGLGGWADGFLAEGYDVVGFDIERHRYPKRGLAIVPGEYDEYPGQLVLQDVLTLHGSQFKGAAVIVASPPCQAYSYRAMPWKRAKALPPPDNTLFDACFRIQREAGNVPMVVENVKGAQPWVGRARWHYGSFYLWGDVPALMPNSRVLAKVPGLNWSGSDKPGYVAKAFNDTAVKNNGGLWFAIGSPGQKVVLQNPVNGGWFGGNTEHRLRGTSSHSMARKAASAQIAKIPLPLAQHIARVFKPVE